MVSEAIITFTVIEGGITYKVPEKVHLALQFVSEMQKQHIPGSVTMHVDTQGNVKIERKNFF